MIAQGRYVFMPKKKAFISLYFLAVFLCYETYLNQQLENRSLVIKIIANLKQDHLFYLAERRILLNVEKELKNGKYDTEFIDCVITNPKEKVMRIFLNLEKQEIVSYKILS